MKKIDQINGRITKARAKLEEIKNNYEANSGKIKTMVLEKVNLLADEIIESSPERKKKILDIEKELNSLRKNIESSGPELISALEKRIGGIQAEKTAEDLRLSFEKQKIVAKKVVELSAKLIEGLEECNRTNDELRKTFAELSNLGKITKKGVFKLGDRTTLGSFECLRMLLVTLRQEYSTGRPRSCQQCRIMQW